MSSSITSSAEPAHSGKRGAAFADAVAEKSLKADGVARDGVTRAAGLALAVVGIVLALLAWINSNGLSDGRDIASMQILAIVGVAVTVLGSGLFVAGVVARVLRLWLLRQLVESQDRADQLAAALAARD
ncbi:hypothetical protein [Nocardioides sp. zg-DK7169]|uniref:hypothetical protein n=1 Tax=Nocardioides sp. zg-DK7169 TaxID=2736600 RepID=UPI001C130717|nr:hypothetical protein [Nocardioides sp. zg-DK7169]